MKQIISDLFHFFRSLFSSTYNFKYVNEEPEVIRSKLLYVIGENEFHTYAVMLCPCGCESKIHLNLITNHRPAWQISKNGKYPTLTPSIWRQVGCRSHFFLRQGHIVWAGNAPSKG
ncbi:DUF6527 family protein [Pseudoalteromonas sp. JC3]|uniref:DUF6527 family protein n=1 Tax=Pseudoalteromonas sp. JC3 TaxID=2810196 RepID=UPI003364F557